MPKLHAHSDEELMNVIEWMARPGGMDGTEFSNELADECSDYLADSLSSRGSTWPKIITIPPQYAAVLDYVIEDWCEVLSSHSEEFYSYLQEDVYHA